MRYIRGTSFKHLGHGPDVLLGDRLFEEGSTIIIQKEISHIIPEIAKADFFERFLNPKRQFCTWGMNQCYA